MPAIPELYDHDDPTASRLAAAERQVSDLRAFIDALDTSDPLIRAARQSAYQAATSLQLALHNFAMSRLLSGEGKR